MNGERVSDQFLRAAVVPRDSSHAAGTLRQANEILAANPHLPLDSIYTAAALGDDVVIRDFLQRDHSLANKKAGPYDWDALTYLCFSRYLRLDKNRSAGFVAAARSLLAAGADANSGFYEENWQGDQEWEPVLYGAAGVAHHAGVTQLLLAHGANPSDDEVVYHTPETYDNAALKLIVNTGRLSQADLALMLVRKHDFHDYDGALWLLEHGADPNHVRERGFCPLHHALRRDNSLQMIQLLLDHNADAQLVFRGRSAVQLAAWCGRSDVLEEFAKRGVNVQLTGTAALVAACALDDVPTIRQFQASNAAAVHDAVAHGGELLREFAGTGNTNGVRNLLDIGVSANTAIVPDDGYWGIAAPSSALHVAAWRLRHDVVKLLVERGADVTARDGADRTPLQLAVRACVDSYWTDMRSPASVQVLLAAGATTEDVPYPSGYAAVDELIRSHGK